MLRKTHAKYIQKSNPQFQLRGHEVKRIEAFSDAVFAFAGYLADSLTGSTQKF